MVLTQMNNRVVVTGAGTISSLGNEWSSVKSNILNKRSAVRYMKEWEQYKELGTKLAAPIDDFCMPSHYTVKKTRSMGRVAKMAVLATEYALEMAGLLNDPVIKNGDTGVSYGSAAGSSDGAMELFDMLDSNCMKKLKATSYLRLMSHTAAVNLGVYFGTQGRMNTTSSACTAGSQGIGAAYEAIKYGHQKIMISGGAEELCPTQAGVFDVLYATSLNNDNPKASVAAYDESRDGLVLGEGACTLILESYEHALNRNAEILAEVVGYATNTDGNHLIRPNQKTMAKVMNGCLTNANVSADQVGYISGHGTGTEHGDISESLAVSEVFGSHVPFSALKGYTGHTLGSCGAFEAWASINMMNEGWFAANLNLSKPDARCAKLDYIMGQPRELMTDLVMSNNFAFGGINTSLLFKRIT